MRSDEDRLRDILAAIQRILDKTSEGRSAFDANEMLRIWVLYHLQIIGEAARGLSSDFRLRYPDKVWAMAAGMRNILVHHYFEIDGDEIWKVLEHDLIPLRTRVEGILAQASE
jgi:uncharacterized protein with HEPN domain